MTYNKPTDPITPISSSDWKATYKGQLLQVKGRVEVPTSGITGILRTIIPGADDPKLMLLELILEREGRIHIPAIETIAVEFSEVAPAINATEIDIVVGQEAIARVAIERT